VDPKENEMKRAGLIALLVILDARSRRKRHGPLDNDQRARDIFEQLININTTGSSGQHDRSQRMPWAKRLHGRRLPAADVQVIGREGSPKLQPRRALSGPGGGPDRKNRFSCCRISTR